MDNAGDEGRGGLTVCWESQATSCSCPSPSFSVSLGLLLVIPLPWSPLPLRCHLTPPSPLLHAQVPLPPSRLSQPGSQPVIAMATLGPPGTQKPCSCTHTIALVEVFFPGPGNLVFLLCEGLPELLCSPSPARGPQPVSLPHSPCHRAGVLRVRGVCLPRKWIFLWEWTRLL